ncbi:zinc-ribbon domain-containing protein, partial [Streptomyces sp. WAC05292]|uniref:zinc-ribbon domain-containing protein n=1 Tax=Streptomyces sp. WAC05292 TaxID=2487418 RepID=UPI000F737856
MSMHRPSGCPSCAEPLEEGDRFCGYCGSPVCAFPPPLPAGARRRGSRSNRRNGPPPPGAPRSWGSQT